VSCARGELFCFLCGDYVYDTEFDLMLKLWEQAHRHGREFTPKDMLVGNRSISASLT
jgi:hypothetical protein